LKKEVFTVLLLVIILALSILNSCCLNKITDSAIEMVDGVKKDAENGNWEGAESATEKIIEYWKSKDTYVHIVLCHSDVDSMTNDLYELLEHVYSKDIGGTRSYSELVKTHLDSIGMFESVRLGSVF
jgi:isocitrate dehydrogenase kinase/phosphatase